MKIVLLVNSECNAGCRHCYISYKGHREPEETVELTERLIAQGHEVVIAGSETLLEPDYLKAYVKAGQNYLLTNGILLLEQPEMFDRLHEWGIEELQLSLHFGIQKYLKSVPEEIVTKAIQESKRKGFRIQMNTDIAKENYGKVSDMCRKAFELGADKVQFIRHVKTNKIKSNHLTTINEDEKEQFFGLVVQAREKYGKKDLEIIIHGNFSARKGSQGEELAKKNIYCPAGISFLAITPDNNIYACPYLMDEPIGKLIGSDIKLERNRCPGKRDRCITEYLC